MAGTGTDDTSLAAVESLREDVVPQVTSGLSAGEVVGVTGFTAGSVDFNELMAERIWYVFAFVFAMAFLLLLVTFRSIVIPIKAIALNVLSVAAALGIVTWVFQDGNLEGLLNFDSTGAITAWFPLMLFVILFGLSMDYHVFILSRIKEAVDRGESTSDAISHGIKSTAGVVTAAAIVMVAVFGIFATLQFIDMKQFGVGLATAILIDATIVRGVLLPATMKLLGDWNWYLPRWLEWLPKGPALEGERGPGGPAARTAWASAHGRGTSGRGLSRPSAAESPTIRSPPPWRAPVVQCITTTRGSSRRLPPKRTATARPGRRDGVRPAGL